MKNISLGSSVRVGVLLDSFTVVPACIHHILRDIVATPGLELVLACGNAAPKPSPRPWRKRLTSLRGKGWFIYCQMDSRYQQLNDPSKEVEVSELLSKVPACFTTMPKQTRFVDRFEQDAIEKIKAANLDVLLRFGFRILKGDILNCARFGVWSFHHGDNDFYRGGPALFWEMYEANPVCGAILQILNEKLDDGTVIYKSFSSTNLFSLRLNRNAVFWKSSAFVLRKLKDLLREGPTALDPIPPAADSKPKMYTRPTNWQALKFCFVSGTRIVRESLLRRNWHVQWFVAFAKNDDSNPPQFKIIYPPPDRFFADPFIVAQGSSDFIFFEDYSFKAGKGIISCIEIDGAGRIGHATPVLEEPFHLSYPFLFKDDGHLYMIPEATRSNSIRLYRCEQFPCVWKLERILMEDVAGHDPTIHYQDGKYWMFVNIPERGANLDDELHLFYADSLSSPWTPHPKNPIVSDVRRARPAGALFVENGCLCRVSQNGAVRYGHSMTVHAIEELSATTYRESPIRKISPSWLPARSLCTHTLNKSQRYVVTDGCRLLPKTLLGTLLSAAK